jgi:hypothetical protein
MLSAQEPRVGVRAVPARWAGRLAIIIGLLLIVLPLRPPLALAAGDLENAPGFDKSKWPDGPEHWGLVDTHWSDYRRVV